MTAAQIVALLLLGAISLGAFVLWLDGWAGRVIDRHVADGLNRQTDVIDAWNLPPTFLDESDQERAEAAATVRGAA